MMFTLEDRTKLIESLNGPEFDDIKAHDERDQPLIDVIQQQNKILRVAVWAMLVQMAPISQPTRQPPLTLKSKAQ